MLQRGNKSTQNGQGDVANTAVPLMKSASIKDMGENMLHLFDISLII